MDLIQAADKTPFSLVDHNQHIGAAYQNLYFVETTSLHRRSSWKRFMKPPKVARIKEAG
jgi:hypothetical protein